jgi:PAB1-binding protein PBP1
MTHQLGPENAAVAGRQLMSMIGKVEGASNGNHEQFSCPPPPWQCNRGTVEGAGNRNHEQHGRPLQPWRPVDSHSSSADSTACSETSPMDLNVVLEDMLDSQGPWDQFEANEKRFGVKSSFDRHLSQYTTPLQVANVSEEMRHEANRIATEIEREQKARKQRDADGYFQAANDGTDEEARFSAVSREPGIETSLVESTREANGDGSAEIEAEQKAKTHVDNGDARSARNSSAELEANCSVDFLTNQFVQLQ